MLIPTKNRLVKIITKVNINVIAISTQIKIIELFSEYFYYLKIPFYLIWIFRIIKSIPKSELTISLIVEKVIIKLLKKIICNILIKIISKISINL